jgi:hypothetical protein
MLLTEAGMTREELRPLLGHKQSNTTDIYVRTAQVLTVKAFDRARRGHFIKHLDPGKHKTIKQKRDCGLGDPFAASLQICRTLVLPNASCCLLIHCQSEQKTTFGHRFYAVHNAVL